MFTLNWSDYFDHIYCIHFVEYKEREKEMMEELKRVGILDSGIFSFKYTFSTALDDVLMNSYNFNRVRNNSNFKKSALNLSIGHYSVMKEALGLGYEKILILEDDMAFLKDENELKEVLDNMPEKWDTILFDKVGIGDNWKTYIEKGKVNDFYAKYAVLWSTGCYALNKKGMKHITSCQEKRFNVADYYTNAFSTGPNMELVYDDVNRVFAIKSLAIQIPSKGDTITEHGQSKWVYKQNGLSDCGMDVNLYNIEI